MDRMKTFLTYALLIIGFFILSLFLEDGLIKATYTKISGQVDSSFEQIDGNLTISDVEVKAANTMGYIKFKIKNGSEKDIEKCYAKIELFNKLNRLVDTEYFEVLDFKAGETRDFNVKFNANNIKSYKISVEESKPDTSNIVEVFGWEMDLSNLFGFGIDISNLDFFGKPLKEVFDWNNIKTRALGFWAWFMGICSGVPWWGWFGGWLFYVGLL